MRIRLVVAVVREEITIGAHGFKGVVVGATTWSAVGAIFRRDRGEGEGLWDIGFGREPKRLIAGLTRTITHQFPTTSDFTRWVLR